MSDGQMYIFPSHVFTQYPQEPDQENCNHLVALSFESGEQESVFKNDNVDLTKLFGVLRANYCLFCGMKLN